MDSKNYVLGFPRIGEFRELKKALELYWSKKLSFVELEDTAMLLRKKHWQIQKDAGIELISINDFSYYDNMLDMMFTLGCIPHTHDNITNKMQQYFAVARGDETHSALGMTKWLNTNYHYIVPELDEKTQFAIDLSKIEREFKEVTGIMEPKNIKINLIGPFTFLHFAKNTKGTLFLLDRIVRAYIHLLEQIDQLASNLTVDFIEPVFAKDLDIDSLERIKDVYEALNDASTSKIIVSTFFEHANEAVKELAKTKIDAIALDFVSSDDHFSSLEALKDTNIQVLCGVVDGRNIWVNDFEKSLEKLNEIAKIIPKERLSIGTSCSLLHVPFTTRNETKLSNEIKSYLSFGLEKLDEIRTLSSIFFDTDSNNKNKEAIKQNAKIIAQKKSSKIVNNPALQERISSLKQDDYKREQDFSSRIKIQKEHLGYDDLPTTTIGSFPQDGFVRKTRRDYKNGKIGKQEYTNIMKDLIKQCVKDQEDLGLDILVHGEFERNDMVEYFGEQLEGFAFSENGWVQSYGSRCVKPPILYGDVSRPKPMTLDWITYAQSLTKKPLKGMLTGPITIMNWSFVRDDIPFTQVLPQIALAIADEISDLQNAKIGIIQVDEAAFKEGYPLRKAKVKEYEENAIKAFLLATSVAKPQTQIHTHMCYSNFKDIMHAIEAMDADVISIETSREGESLLEIFKENNYQKEIGAGVYDIHSPRVPSVEELKNAIEERLKVTLKTRMWVNPDCGLKTRKKEECFAALKNMVEATKAVKESYKNNDNE